VPDASIAAATATPLRGPKRFVILEQKAGAKDEVEPEFHKSLSAT
jgi:hypothetical protein